MMPFNGKPDIYMGSVCNKTWKCVHWLKRHLNDMSRNVRGCFSCCWVAWGISTSRDLRLWLCQKKKSWPYLSLFQVNTPNVQQHSCQIRYRTPAVLLTHLSRPLLPPLLLWYLSAAHSCFSVLLSFKWCLMWLFSCDLHVCGDLFFFFFWGRVAD